jgi:chromosome segregation ATPase
MKPYEEKLLDEHTSLCARIHKLEKSLNDWEDSEFIYECTRSQLQWQCDAMQLYRKAIEGRNDFQRLQARFIHE